MGDRVTLGGWGHLAVRFVQVLSARPLGPREQSEVAALLREQESDLFWGQPIADQRHGLEAARAVLRRAPGRRDLARAALLHDVGKQRAGLGVAGRVLASAAAELGARPSGRLGAYLDHGPLGAGMLEEAGAEEMVVAYARSHHDERPGSISLEGWALLQWSDRVSESGKAPGREATPIA